MTGWITFEVYLLILSFAAILLLGLFVYLRNRTLPLSRAFCIFSGNSALWMVTVIMILISRDGPSHLFWVRIACSISIFIPANFLLFASTLSRREFPPLNKVAVPYSIALALSVLCHTPLVIQGFEINAKNQICDIYGPLFPLYSSYFIIVLGGTLWYLALKIKLHKGFRRTQFQYVFFGSLIYSILAICTGLVAPLYGLTAAQIAGLSPAFALVWACFIAYAIAKYRLMDITVVIKRATLYATLTASVTAGYIGIVLVTNWLFGGVMGLRSLIPAMIPALLIAFAFTPLKEAIQAFVDKTLFKKRYDHRRILGDLSKILTSIFSLEELLSLILRVITKSMGIESGVIYLPDDTGVNYAPQAVHEGNSEPMRPEPISADSPLVNKLMWRRELIIREQLERLPQAPETKAVTGLLEQMKADICIPIYSKDILTGIIFFGHKETGETFTIEDIEMFTTLSNHIAVAIENAQLYTKVEESKRYQEILMNNLTSGVIAVDLSSRVTAFNSRAEAILRLPAKEILGRSMAVLPAELRAILSDTLRQRESFSTEEVLIRADGDKDVPLAVSSSTFNSYDGKTIGALIVFSDLTERKVLEAEMRRADRLASLGTLAAGMAHEIKNPLVSLKTFTQLLPEKYCDREFREDFARLANQEVDRINYLVEQLLDFARPSSPMFKTTDLREILNNTLFLLDSRIHEQGVEIQRDIVEEPLSILADGDQLKQVLLNVIINALQAMDNRGTLTVRAKKVGPEQIASFAARGRGPAKRLSRLKKQGSAVVEISDNGRGIGPNDLPHLFDPFFTTKEAGVGLGLAIAHSIIEEHGGIIDVESTVGEGTTFSITLPLMEHAA